MEEFRPAPIELTGNDDNDISEDDKVKWWMQRIDDAYEPGSHENVAELMMEMKAACDPDIILLLSEPRRHGLQSPQTDPEQ